MSTGKKDVAASVANNAPPFSGGAEFFQGGGEMGAKIRSLDWAQTPLGPPETWPQSLVTAVRMMLCSRYPMFVWWGEELTNFYNDALIKVLGKKHPDALGRSAREVWHEIWNTVGPQTRQVMDSEEATWNERVLLEMERSGYKEETYFTWSYSPAFNDAGKVSGVFCACSEETKRVLSERRLGVLSRLSAENIKAETPEAVCARTAEVLSQSGYDIPFALIYLLSSDGSSAALAGYAGIGKGADDAPAELSTKSFDPWPASAAIEGQTVTLNGLERRRLPGGPWPDPVGTALVLPFRGGDGAVAGFLVLGASPRRAFDEDYRSFFNLVTEAVSGAIGRAQGQQQERKRGEALAEINRAKTVFFSNVSHEFRTPLTLMIGPLEDTLAGTSLQPAERECLDLAHRNSLRLLKLVNSLLDFSRIEAGRTQAAYQPTEVAAHTAELASNFRSACERAGLKLIVDCRALPEPLYIDREMWEKIVLNLLSNAFKFTFEGEIAVGLRLVKGQAELSVRDTGVGIPPEALPRLFERFHRIAGQQSRSFEGSGIGLALVQELAKLHGGTISVESLVGRGTTFTIRFPLGTEHLPKEHIEPQGRGNSSILSPDAYVEEALQWLGAAGSPLSEFSGRVPDFRGVPASVQGARILLADDNSDMRNYISRLLGNQCEVQAVSDGQEALDAARARRPDLILSDVMMPRLDGFGLLRALRSDPQLSDVPIIMLSARAGEESRIEGLEAGADDYLVKPFPARELIARVGSALELSRARRNVITAARDSERRIRYLFQQAPSFICILRGPEHMFEFTNDSYMRLAGEGRDFIGKPVREAFPEVKGQGFFELLDEVYRSGKPFTGLETPIQLQRKPGEPLVNLLLDFIYQPIADESGQVTGIFVEGFEVTQRVRAQAALRESEERYRTLFESIDEGFCILEAIPASGETPTDFRYIAVNPALEVQSGVPAKVGDTIRDVIPAEAQTWIDLFDNILRTGDPVRGERGLLSQGRVLDVYSFRLEDETKRRVGVIFTDVTARKRAEAELLRANQDLEQFAYSASHDLQEPLRSVSIYSELLDKRYRDKLDGQAIEFLDFLRSGAARMETLIRDVLAYTQVGTITAPGEDVDAEESLKSALANLSEAIAASKAEVTSDPLPRLRVNRTHLQQLFQNLVGNAIKYRRPDVAPLVHVSVERQKDGWEFAVSDNGIGINPQYKERIFGLFKRLHTGDEYSGTGIGLAICQRIVERYQGRIWVESRQGHGSTFRFTLDA